MDELAIFSAPLTSDEVRQVYESGQAVNAEKASASSHAPENPATGDRASAK